MRLACNRAVLHYEINFAQRFGVLQRTPRHSHNIRKEARRDRAPFLLNLQQLGIVGGHGLQNFRVGHARRPPDGQLVPGHLRAIFVLVIGNDIRGKSDLDAHLVRAMQSVSNRGAQLWRCRNASAFK